jgi:putative CRISPR-associated protein (TIGR02620 family)
LGVQAVKLLITKHASVREFAKLRYEIESFWNFLTRYDITQLPENAQVFGNLPIPLVADILARPDLRYYHLIIPNVVTEGHDLPHLLSHAYFQRFHVEPMEEER